MNDNAIKAVQELVNHISEWKLETLGDERVSRTCFKNEFSNLSEFREYYMLVFVKAGLLRYTRGSKDYSISSNFHSNVDWKNVDWDEFGLIARHFQGLRSKYNIEKEVLSGDINFESIFPPLFIEDSDESTNWTNSTKDEVCIGGETALKIELINDETEEWFNEAKEEDSHLVEMVCDWMDLERINKYDSMTGEAISKVDRFKELFRKYNEKE